MCGVLEGSNSGTPACDERQVLVAARRNSDATSSTAVNADLGTEADAGAGQNPGHGPHPGNMMMMTATTTTATTTTMTTTTTTTTACSPKMRILQDLFEVRKRCNPFDASAVRDADGWLEPVYSRRVGLVEGFVTHLVSSAGRIDWKATVRLLELEATSPSSRRRFEGLRDPYASRL